MKLCNFMRFLNQSQTEGWKLTHFLVLVLFSLLPPSFSSSFGFGVLVTLIGLGSNKFKNNFFFSFGFAVVLLLWSWSSFKDVTQMDVTSNEGNLEVNDGDRKRPLIKPTKYHYYPHNQHLYLLPECATQQVSLQYFFLFFKRKMANILRKIIIARWVWFEPQRLMCYMLEKNRIKLKKHLKVDLREIRKSSLLRNLESFNILSDIYPTNT